VTTSMSSGSSRVLILVVVFVGDVG
jgi:hypothetical protein